VGKQVTGDDFGDDRPHSVIVLGNPGHQLIDNDLVIPFELTPECVRHESLSQVTGQIGLSPGQQALQFSRGGKGCSVGQLPGRVDRDPDVILVPPAPDSVEVLQAEADGIEHLVTVGTHGLRGMEFGPLPHGQTLYALLFLLVELGNVCRGRRDALTDHIFAVDGCASVCELEAWPNRQPVYDGSAFIGDAGPENSVSAFGFFVHRPFISAEAAAACSKLEVMHVYTDWLDGEHGVSWFFHAVGSGVFIDCHNLPVSGSIEVHQNRQAFVDYHGGWWGGTDDSRVRERMEEHGIALLIFTASDFTVFGTDGTNPSTEFIVRHAQWDSSETSNSRRSCLDDPSIGLHLFTGIDGTVPCACEVRDQPMAAVNCDLTTLV